MDCNTRRIFFAGLGLTYLCAFVSFAVQVKGLIGSEGIMPITTWLEHVASRAGGADVWQLPTLLWLNSSDTALLLICWGGAGLSLLLIAGLCPVLILVCLWGLYLSLVVGGSVFMHFQWDILLLETGFLAIFWAPLSWRMQFNAAGEPPRYVLWLLRWLLFRLLFMSGLVKLLSGDAAWLELTALDFHYETQPLPTWMGWYAHQLPSWFQQFSVGLMYVIELGVPLCIFAPRRWRHLGGLILIGFQVLILLTGNYGFFNLLTIVLCLTLFDYSFGKNDSTRRTLEFSRYFLIPLTLIMFCLSLTPTLTRFFRHQGWAQPVVQVYRWAQPYHLVGGYGLFTVMTKVRSEITVEGSLDGETWKPYTFHWKPGALNERPRFVAPHMPRVDWQLWFASLSSLQRQPWLQRFLLRLLEDSPEVLALLKHNPFSDQPPRYIRATIADYTFTDWATKQATGQWWQRSAERPYAPALSLKTSQSRFK